VLAQQACAATDQDAAASGPSVPSTSAVPSASAVPSTSAGASSGGPAQPTSSPAVKPPAASPATSSPPAKPASRTSNVFAGDRQVYLLPVNSEATVAVGASGQAVLSEDFGNRALFVLTPVAGDRYWIRTAKLRVGGEAYCLGVQGKNVRTVACDASAQSQLFRFRKTGTAEGKSTYTIRTGADTYLVQDPEGTLNPGGTGVVAIRIGEGTPDIDTPFLLPDRGKASMPAVD
jgi:hypothetical protein